DALVAIGTVGERRAGDGGGVVVESDIDIHAGRRQMDFRIDLEVSGELRSRTEGVAAMAGRVRLSVVFGRQEDGGDSQGFHIDYRDHRDFLPRSSIGAI